MAASAQLLDGAAAFQQGAKYHALRFRERRHEVPSLRIAVAQAKPMQQRRGRSDELGVVVRDEPIAPARSGGIELPGHRIHLASLRDSGGCGKQCAGVIGRFHDDGRLGKARDDPIASGEVRLAAQPPRGRLRDERPALGDDSRGSSRCRGG